MSGWRAGDLAVVRAPRAFLYGGPEEKDRTDEVLSGWALALTDGERDGMAPVLTHYGYPGWIRSDAIRRTDREELAGRPGTLRRAADRWLDLYAEPRVQGALLRTLPRDSLVSLTGREEEGWTPVRDADGLEGWVHTALLDSRRDGDGYLLAGRNDPDWFLKRAKARLAEGNEAEIRETVVRTAAAWGRAPYRWAGKAPDGIDCSGLVFMCYMESGILIYRDARIRPEYPVREIPREQMKKGDLIFFPGHVAIYDENGKYVHATGWKGTPWVTVNSLNPASERYRPDLAEKIIAVGSVF